MTLDPDALTTQWANGLPSHLVAQLAAALRQGPDSVRDFVATVVLPDSGAAVRQAIQLAEAGHGPYAAGRLTAIVEHRLREPVIRPVWSGTSITSEPQRLTIAVVNDLIGEAREQLVLVTYAAHPSPAILAALRAAADRGVALTLVLERTADNPRFHGADDPFPGVAATRLCWPAAARPPGAALHAKLLVVDDHVALVGSANLTGAAFERNLECGLLIRGGPLPRALQLQLLRMPELVPY